jgi:hypothetical protein
MRLLIGIALFAVAACTRAAGTAAILNMGIAAAASGVSRAYGGCYAACPTSTTCNPATGYCDTLPCHGRCSEDEHCDASGLFDRCLPGREGGPDVEIGRDPSEGSTTSPAENKDAPAKPNSTNAPGAQSPK